MPVKFYKIVSSILITCFLTQLVACGTILHPERKGQRAGQIDPAIAIFDAIGLLFFLIPGVIAFAVDFNNGTIYLPGGKRAEISPEELQRVKGQDGLDKSELSKILQGQGIEVDASELEVQRLNSYQELDVKMKNFSMLYSAVY